MTTTRKITVAEKLRWNTNQTLETNTYIRCYSDALDRHMDPATRQEFFMISKFLTDGTVALSKNQISLAAYHFEKAERYIRQIDPTRETLLKFIANVYGRSKSFHYYKLNDHAAAIRLIEETQTATEALEAKEGLAFLVLDRVSQYHNMARLFFSLGLEEKGFHQLSACICFLMTGHSDVLSDLNRNYIKEYDGPFIEMKSSLLQQLLTETILSLQKEPSAELFRKESASFLEPIFQRTEKFVKHSDTDEQVHDWLSIARVFYAGDILSFKKLSIRFISTSKSTKLKEAIKGYFSYC
jgi:hypothetical protein